MYVCLSVCLSVFAHSAASHPFFPSLQALRPFCQRGQKSSAIASSSSSPSLPARTFGIWRRRCVCPDVWQPVNPPTWCCGFVGVSWSLVGGLEPFTTLLFFSILGTGLAVDVLYPSFVIRLHSSPVHITLDVPRLDADRECTRSGTARQWHAISIDSLSQGTCS